MTASKGGFGWLYSLAGATALAVLSLTLGAHAQTAHAQTLDHYAGYAAVAPAAPALPIRRVEAPPGSGAAPVPEAYAGSVVATVANVGSLNVPLSGAESPRLFVSNAAQPPSAWSRTAMAQGFATGPDAGGYLLGSIELYLESPPAYAVTMPLVTLHADDSGRPGEMLARFRNPDEFTEGANRFWAPYDVVLDPDTTYHVVTNLAADDPQAFSLVTSGKFDVPMGEPGWGVQAGSWLSGSDRVWQPNENHALRFALHERGENDPPYQSNTPAGSADSQASDRAVAAEEIAAAPPPPPSSTSGETRAGTTAAASGTASTAPGASDDDDDDPPPAVLPSRDDELGPWIAGTAIAGIILNGMSDDDDVPVSEQPPPLSLSTDASLSDLAVFDPDGMEVELRPMFTSTTPGYTARVPHAVAWITIDPTTSDADARLQFLDADDMELADADPGTTGFQANLPVGTTTFRMNVTAEDRMAMRTYNLSVTRELAPPGQVIGLTVETALEALDVSWTWDIAANGYKVQWKSGNEAFESGGSREQVISGGSMTAYRIANLTAGVEYTVRVIATRFGTSDGPPSNEVTGTPRGLSTDATLSDLAVFGPDGMEIALTPMFSPGTTGYEASVENAVAWITMDYTTGDANAQVQHLDAADMALADADIGRTGFQANLAVGANTIKVRVTAEDGVAMQTYAVTVTRALAAPGQVMGVEVDPAIESLVVSWDAVEIADGYKLQWKSGSEAFAGGGTRERVLAGAGTTTDTLPNLTAGVEYTVRVIATRTGASDGPASAEVTGTPLALSTDATLSDLAVFGPDGMEIALTPMFSPGTTGYEASVENAVAWITMDYTTGDANAQVQYLDAADMVLADSDIGRTGFQANLAVGANTFKVRVTAEDGVAMQTYAVTVTRALAAPGQVIGVEVEPAIESLVVSWDAVEIADGYKLQWKSGSEAFAGGGTRERVLAGAGTTTDTLPNLTAGVEYTVRVIATRTGASDGPPSAEVTGTPLALSTDATLSDLAVFDPDGKEVALTPMFSPGTTGYEASVENAVAWITMDYTTGDANAQVQYLDAADMVLADSDIGRTGFQANLAVGANTFKVRVTAEDGVAMQTYAVTVTRALAAPGQVMGVEVDPAIESLVVSWDAVEIADGYRLQWKSGSEAFAGGGTRERVLTGAGTTTDTLPNLTAGVEYTVRVIATRTGASDGPPSAEVTGTPLALSTDATLSDLAVFGPDGMEIALTPMFSPGTTGYEASVENAVAWITMDYTTGDANAQVQYLDAADMALADSDIGRTGFQANLAVGANTIKVRVTAEDGVAMQTYAVTVTRALAAPGQVMGVEVEPAIESLVVSWDAVEIADGYKLQWKSGSEAFAGGGTRERVLAGAGTTTDTLPNLTAGVEYTVRVIATRTGASDGPPSAEVTGTPLALSTDATLSDLAVFDPDGKEVALTPMFSPGTTGYEASVENAVAWITMDYTTGDANAQVQYLDAADMVLADADAGRSGFQANLAVGANTIKVRVTAEDGVAMQTYAVTVTRALAAPGQVIGVEVEPYVEALEVSWDPVENADKYMVQWKWGDHDFEGGGDREQVTNGGSTVSMIQNLEGGMEYTLRVIAFRTNVGMGPPSDEVKGVPLSLSSDAALGNLRVTETDGTAIALSPMFSSTVTGYSASVAHAVSRVTILPTTSHANAQIRYLDANEMELDDADDGIDDFQADLAVGANTVKVKITAEDDLATATYTLTLTRSIAPADQPTNLRVLAAPEALIALWDAVDGADGYKLQWKSGEEDYESGGDREAVIDDGTDTIYTILYLVAGTEYTLRLIATKTGAADSLPSNEAKGTPYAREVRSDPPNTDTDDDDGGGNTNTGGALTDLEVTDPSDVEVTLSPAFSTNTRSYTASVVNTVTWVTFKPTLRDPNATLVYEDGANQALTDANATEDDLQVNLDEGANTVRLRVTPSGETAADTYTVVITRAPANVVHDNSAPTFSAGTATREFAEDMGDATRTGVDIGAPVTADDDDNDPLIYTLEGTDESQFAIVSATGQIRSRTGVNYDRESDASYSVTVKADDSNGGTDTIAVTINLTDVEEKPLAPDAPTVSAVSGSTTSLSVTWTAPANTGRPSITSYDLQYKKTADSTWTDGPQNVSGTNTTISSLDEDTDYDVQIRATNADGDGPYSGTGTGKTAKPGNRAPDFGASSATREFEENFAAETSSGVDVGAPVTATDDDNDTLEYSLEGTDAASFEIDSSSGQISTVSGTNYDRESDSSYSVTVKADDGEGGTDTISVTINLTDVEEKPLAPDAPTVSSVENSTNSLSVTWTAPTNTGRPSITSYDLQYKKSTETDQDWQDGPQNRSGTTATITGLDGNISYDVQVRATNADGDGPWSGTGSGTTNPDPPQIGSAAIRAFDEDVGDGTRSGVDVGLPVTASDHGANHSYTLGGTDSGSFTIGSTTGQIRSRSGTNYDYEAQSSYSVSVESDDGNSGTETIQVTINLNDVTEKPKKPAAPDVESIAGNTRVLYVSWTAPSNTGRPPITSYDLQYREAPSGPWFNGPQDQTGMMASISNLSPSTEYDVQVRATNADGDGPWSNDGSATTAAALPETCAMSENGDVRLADGFTPKEGRVEICAEDPDTSGSYIWGKVCDDYWTDEEAGVVCKALDYHETERYGGRFLKSYFGPGTLPFLLDDLICDGDESSLLDCPVAGGGLASNALGQNNCKAEEAVGVRCVTESEHIQHATEVETDDNDQSPMLSVADVTVYETPGTTMDFVVTLSGTPTASVTVNYATQDGTAEAHIDYVPKSGMVTFPLGTTSRTVSITVLDDLQDEHDEQGERMSLRLSNATGGAHILDGVAYGTIENSDPLPQAWLARFGRAAADQAVEAISGRLTASGPRTSQVTVAGRRLDVSGNTSPAEAGAALAPRDVGVAAWNAHGAPGVGAPQPGAPGIHGISGSSVPGVIGSGLPGGGLGSGLAGGSFGSGLPGIVGPSRGYASSGYRSSGVSGRQLLTGTSFQWALGVDEEADESADGVAGVSAAGNRAGSAGNRAGSAGNRAGSAGNGAGFASAERRATWTAWGEGAATRFSGAEDSLSLQGDVATATLGIDREGERWMAGVAVAFSEGAGAFTALGDDIAGTQTGTAGGLLQTTLTTVYPYARYRLNDRLSVWGALGYGQGDLRLTEGRAGTVVDTDTGLRVGALGARGVILDANGYELALRSDAMRVRMTSDTVVGLAGAVANVGRVRALLEGSRMFALGENRAIEPTLEFGLRHDSGDAETGSGVELGAGIRYTDAVFGLTLEANARGLVAHQDSAYEEWGAWATLRLDPGEAGKGLSLSLSPTWGAANSGLDQLWNSVSVPGYGVGAPGYGVGAPGYGTGAPGYGVGAQGYAVGAPGYGTGSPGHAAGATELTAGSPGFAPASQAYVPGSPAYAANAWLNPGARLSAELGYGVDAFRGMGMGTYYSGLERAGSGFQSWRLGKRWELGTQLQMSVEGERNEFELMDPDHAISIQGLLLW